jgi:hypothetical protein
MPGFGFSRSRNSLPGRIRADPTVSPLGSAAIAHGFSSCIAVPLVARTTQEHGKSSWRFLVKVDLCGALSLSLYGGARAVR